jgi:putative transposase
VLLLTNEEPKQMKRRVGRTPRSAADPLVGSTSLRIPKRFRNCSLMPSYRRRLPHIYETGQAVFLTWRLHDSLPPNRAFRTGSVTSGQAFVAMDRLLDEARTGSFYLRQPALADMLVEAIHHNADVLMHYALHAFVVMPNHVHVLAAPAVALSILTKSLKGITAKRANTMLALTGSPFWQEESYDHLVRHAQEFDKIRNYIEENPVRAGLVREASEYRWSSAANPMPSAVGRTPRSPTQANFGFVQLSVRAAPPSP